MLGPLPDPRRGGLQDRRVPVPHVGARTPTRPRRPRSSPGCRWRRRPRASPCCSASSSSTRARRPPLGGRGGAPRRLTIVAGNLMAIPQTDAKRLLAYSGIAHIGYMLLGMAALSPDGVAMLLFYLVAYLFSNMGAFMVVEAVAAGRGLVGAPRPSAGSPSARRCSRSRCCCSCSRSGGIPFVVGFWAKLYVLLGGGPGGALRARAAGRGADGGGALLLPAGREADVHRRAGPRDAGAGAAGARPRAPGQRCSRSCCSGSTPARSLDDRAAAPPTPLF